MLIGGTEGTHSVFQYRDPKQIFKSDPYLGSKPKKSGFMVAANNSLTLLQIPDGRALLYQDSLVCQSNGRLAHNKRVSEMQMHFIPLVDKMFWYELRRH